MECTIDHGRGKIVNVATMTPLAVNKPLPSPFLGTTATLVLCAIVPLIVVGTTSASTGSSVWVPAVVSTIIAGARFGWIVGSRGRHPFEMTTWLFFYVFGGLAPLVQRMTDVDPSTTPNVDHSFDSTAFGIVIATEVALIVGSTMGKPRADVIEQTPRRVVDSRRTSMVSWVLIVLALGYIAAIGFTTLFTNRTDRGAALSGALSDDAARTILSALVTLGLLVAVIAQLQVRRERKARGDKRTSLLLAVSMVLLLLVVNPIGSPRFLFMTVALALVAALGAFAEIRLYRVISLSGIAALVVLLPILDSFRRSTSTIRSAGSLDSLTGGDFDAFAQTINTAWWVETNGLAFGNQLLGVLLFWVPRSMWPGKPVDTGILLGEAKEYGFTNLSAPLPAELYINAGWFGVIAGALLLGFGMRRWDARSEQRIQLDGVPTVLGCVIPFYMVMLLRGSLLQAAANLAVILLAWFFVTRPAPAEEFRAGPVAGRPASTG
ncbi:hypothetical protein [Microbacterium enclense]|uniref:hypothetical protein n=1 Tax=Microbacterium enclense TaxID=993073 RepID=UPI0034292B1B